MEDVTKPDLVVHSLYVEALKNYNLSYYYNVLTLDDMKLATERMKDVYAITDNYTAPIDLTLKPFYTPILISSNEPAATSYALERPTKIYKLTRNAPRYVIWPKNDPLLVCGTLVDRVDYCELFEAVKRATDWAYTIRHYKSVAVFDLDKTLITDQCEKIPESEKLLSYAKQTYDLVILWSHGSALHVDEQIEKLSIGSTRGYDIFDLVIKASEYKSPKNLLSLYNYVPYTKFTRSVLVDDLAANWTPEYDKFIIPYNNNTLAQAIYII